MEPMSLSEALALVGRGGPRAQAAFALVYDVLQELGRRERRFSTILEDAVQSVCVALMTRNTFTAERGDDSARAYLRGALRKHCLTLLGREARYVPAEEAPEPTVAPADPLEEGERRAWVAEISGRFDGELVPSVRDDTIRRSDGRANFQESVQAMRQIAAEEISKAALVEAELARQGARGRGLEGARDALDRRLFNARERLLEALLRLRARFEEGLEEAPYSAWVVHFLWNIEHIDGFDGVMETLRMRARA